MKKKKLDRYQKAVVECAHSYYPWNFSEFLMEFLFVSMTQMKSYIRDQEEIKGYKSRMVNIEAMDEVIKHLSYIVEDKFGELAKIDFPGTAAEMVPGTNKFAIYDNDLLSKQVDRAEELRQDSYDRVFLGLAENIRGWWD